MGKSIEEMAFQEVDKKLLERQKKEKIRIAKQIAEFIRTCQKRSIISKKKEQELGITPFVFDEEDRNNHETCIVLDDSVRFGKKNYITPKQLVSKTKGIINLAKDNGLNFKDDLNEILTYANNSCKEDEKAIENKQKQEKEKEHFKEVLKRIDERNLSQDFLDFEATYKLEEKAIENWKTELGVIDSNRHLYFNGYSKKKEDYVKQKGSTIVRPLNFENIENKYKSFYKDLESLKNKGFISPEQFNEKKDAMVNELKVWKDRAEIRGVDMHIIKEKQTSLTNKLEKASKSKLRMIGLAPLKILYTPLKLAFNIDTSQLLTY